MDILKKDSWFILGLITHLSVFLCHACQTRLTLIVCAALKVINDSMVTIWESVKYIRGFSHES